MLRKTLVFAIAACAVSGAVGFAAPVNLTDIQTQTISGQDFTFNFAAAPMSAGTGTFILHAQGDYDGLTTETLSWDIEGIVLGGPVGGFVNGAGGVGGPFDFTNLVQLAGNIEFQRTYSISALDLAAITSDGIVTINVDLSDQVNLFEPPNYVEVTLQYDMATAAVPEPTSMALFGLTALGFGVGFRRRRGGEATEEIA